jgi:hypothetical protein
MCIFCLGLAPSAEASRARGFAALACEAVDDAEPSAAKAPAPATLEAGETPPSAPGPAAGADDDRSLEAMFAPAETAPAGGKPKNLWPT